VQHALRAFTPDDAKALKAAVSTYPKSGYDLQELLTQLGTGEAIITVLSERGAPTPVAWTRMRAPQSLMGPSADALVDQVVAASSLASEYAVAMDRESAYEKLTAAAAAKAQADAQAAEPAPEAPAPRQAPARQARAPKEEPTVVEQVVQSSVFKSMMRSAGTVIGREITRSIFGTSRRR
jgi:DNA helicase HerA-like ATPase